VLNFISRLSGIWRNGLRAAYSRPEPGEVELAETQNLRSSPRRFVVVVKKGFGLWAEIVRESFPH